MLCSKKKTILTHFVCFPDRLLYKVTCICWSVSSSLYNFFWIEKCTHVNFWIQSESWGGSQWLGSVTDSFNITSDSDPFKNVNHSCVVVKGLLGENIAFWQSIGASNWLLRVIREGFSSRVTRCSSSQVCLVSASKVARFTGFLSSMSWASRHWVWWFALGYEVYIVISCKQLRGTALFQLSADARGEVVSWQKNFHNAGYPDLVS